MDEFSYTQEQIANKTGKSRSHVANILRLLTLPKSVHGLMEKKLISMGHARAIINSNNPEELAHKIAESALTVKETEDLVRDQKIEKLKKSPLVRAESTVKFVNLGHLSDLEKQLSSLLDSRVRIHYNQFKQTGKITIDFEELEKIYSLVKKLSA
jgi:ParB family chromosome partitioning protein